jgi:hypothetical protein
VAHLSALERVHSRLRGRSRRPTFDGIYVTWDDLVRDPSRAQIRPYSHDGRFHAAGQSVGSPVIWHTLPRYGEACRGPDPRTIEIWADPECLAV